MSHPSWRECPCGDSDEHDAIIRAEGAAARQAAIVAWLRDGAPPFTSARGLADAIEAGAAEK